MDGVAANLAKAASGASGWSFGFGRSREDAARIADLEAQVRDLQRWKDLAETQALRMARYEKMLDLIGETQGQSVTARVVVEENGVFGATRIANAGAANGVRDGFAATNENGLVGRVIRVGEYTSRILMVNDSNSKIPVMGRQSGDRALLVGDSVSGGHLEEAETPDKIVEGEIWVTSGDDGQMPLGVRVGRARRDGQVWRIDLAMNDGPVDFVQLAPPPDFAKPEDADVLDDGLRQPNNDRSLMSAAAPASGAQPAPSPPGGQTPPRAPAQPSPPPARQGGGQ
jgi:rod shape-determining protein MreC